MGVRREAAKVVLETNSGPLTTRFVIDGSGGGHWLARRLDLAIARLTPRLLCWYGYVRADHHRPPTLTADSDGWTWIAEVRPSLHQWTRLSFAGTPVLRPPLDGDVVQPSRAADVTWRWVPACAGLGYALAGDAAAVLDPTSARGVLRALMTGVKAAQVALVTLKTPHVRDVACRDYRAWLGAWVHADAEEMRGLYARLPHPPAWAVAPS